MNDRRQRLTTSEQIWRPYYPSSALWLSHRVSATQLALFCGRLLLKCNLSQKCRFAKRCFKRQSIRHTEKRLLKDCSLFDFESSSIHLLGQIDIGNSKPERECQPAVCLGYGTRRHRVLTSSGSIQ